MMKPRAIGARVRVGMSRRRVRARRGSIPASIEIKTAFRAERLEPLRDALEPRGARDVQTRRSVVRARVEETLPRRVCVVHGGAHDELRDAPRPATDRRVKQGLTVLARHDTRVDAEVEQTFLFGFLVRMTRVVVPGRSVKHDASDGVHTFSKGGRSCDDGKMRDDERGAFRPGAGRGARRRGGDAPFPGRHRVPRRRTPPRPSRRGTEGGRVSEPRDLWRGKTGRARFVVSAPRRHRKGTRGHAPPRRPRRTPGRSARRLSCAARGRAAPCAPRAGTRPHPSDDASRNAPRRRLVRVLLSELALTRSTLWPNMRNKMPTKSPVVSIPEIQTRFKAETACVSPSEGAPL